MRFFRRLFRLRLNTPPGFGYFACAQYACAFFASAVSPSGQCAAGLGYFACAQYACAFFASAVSPSGQCAAGLRLFRLRSIRLRSLPFGRHNVRSFRLAFAMQTGARFALSRAPNALFFAMPRKSAAGSYLSLTENLNSDRKTGFCANRRDPHRGEESFSALPGV